ncbi:MULTISPECIES: hypothetical protein [Haloferax]|uniref:Uncharacterized protein n=1 Tax=Haloferax massiliensis TaxID=1476858 RepID=A0A0D6JWC7_9EURY|nr:MULTISPECIES: hypothetical protein [Haloferax]MDS0242487.1 hypothetical protein [Haloferax sp. S2CR25]MDS0445608.1 hypothetical protein [Haloferax sp. S2CR25-2]CQR52913.1 hypothetical protein BN996_03364 [Haloferax massiliensis]
MRTRNAFTRGKILGLKGVGVFADHRRLLLFPLFIVAIGSVIFGGIYVGYESRWLGRVLPGLPAGLQFALLVVGGLDLLLVCSVVVNAWLVAYVAPLLQTGEASFGTSLSRVGRAWQSVCFHAAVVGVIGGLLTILERDRGSVTATLTATVLSASFTTLSFFAIPSAVLDDAGVFEMYRHSLRTVRSNLGETLVVALGVKTFFAILGLVPLIIGQLGVGIVVYLGAAEFQQIVGPVVGAVPASDLVPLLGALVVFGSMFLTWTAGTAVSSVAKTGLYLTYTTDYEFIDISSLPTGRFFETQPTHTTPISDA